MGPKYRRWNGLNLQLDIGVPAWNGTKVDPKLTLGMDRNETDTNLDPNFNRNFDFKFNLSGSILFHHKHFSLLFKSCGEII